MNRRHSNSKYNKNKKIEATNNDDIKEELMAKNTSETNGISQSQSAKLESNSDTCKSNPKDTDNKREKSESSDVKDSANGDGNKSWIPGSQMWYAAREMVETGYKGGKEKVVETHQYISNTKEAIMKTTVAYKETAIEKVSGKYNEVNKVVNDYSLKTHQWLKGDCHESRLENILVKTTSVVLSVYIKMARFGLNITGMKDPTMKKINSIQVSVQERAAQTEEKYPSIAGYKDMMLEYWPVRLVGRIGKRVGQQVCESI
eukprot:Tbor_TRINITY_DN5635_c0_g1::TRINITY_DN5635_c0_g1_i1::g.9035::m.9035